MIQHYSKVALRNLMKYKTQNLISTIGLAVGLLCFSICFYCSRYMQSVDQCFNNYHRLVDINLADEGRMLSGTPAILAEKLTKEYGVNSVSIIQLIVELENDFNIEFQDSELALGLYYDMNDVVAAVAAKLN
jgi:putative ABC transport system permease protein